MSKIETALQQLFDKHRIVFWYDQHHEMREEYESAWLVGVEKVEVDNNEFSLKYRMLREQPKQKFLLYFDGPEPEKLNNWLLDVQLFSGVFSADQISLWMSELELGPEYFNLVEAHKEFFNASGRRDALKARDIRGNTAGELRRKMMAVPFGVSVDDRLESILLHLLDEFSEDKEEKIGLLEKYGLMPYFWEMLKDAFGYESERPHLHDFVITLLEDTFRYQLNEEISLTSEAIVLHNRWQDSKKHQASFNALSEQVARELQIHQKITNYEMGELAEIDTFKVIDAYLLGKLRDGVMNRTINHGECRRFVQHRSSTHWYAENFQQAYEAVEAASAFLTMMNDVQLDVNDIPDGIKKYTATWYQVDQLYRQYIYLSRQVGNTDFFQALNAVIEKQYASNFLLPVNNHWQQAVDDVQDWMRTGVYTQNDFFRRYVEDILLGKAKVAVVISDALRYEVVEELSRRIQSEGRFTTELDAVLGMLPSYTQLGMASLLPNQKLEINNKGNVLADGASTKGREPRQKILQAHTPDSSVLKADEFIKLNRDERRSVFRENQVIYVYHDLIDVTGGDMTTAERTFDAVETTLQELTELVKALRSANFAKILVTADHGFLFQQNAVEEHDFAVTEVAGEEVYLRNRRALVGSGLTKTSSFKAFTAEQVGLQGDYDVLIPKSINRLRLSGAGSRFVHGGASLQEIVIPVLSITRERTKASDTRPVNVDRITPSTNLITTGQIAVTFYQEEPVTAKVLPRTLRVGLYAPDGTLISDSKIMHFDSESKNAQERRTDIRLLLGSEADQYNNQSITLKLEERIRDTNHYRLISSWEYKLTKSSFGGFF